MFFQHEHKSAHVCVAQMESDHGQWFTGASEPPLKVLICWKFGRYLKKFGRRSSGNF